MRTHLLVPIPRVCLIPAPNLSLLRRPRTRIVQVLVVATGMLLASRGLAFGTTWYIKADGTGDAPTIQAGVNAASPGDVVLVASGSYPTTSTVNIGGTPTAVCVAINKNIRLVSENGAATTVIGSANAAVAVYLDGVGSSAEVNGFTLQTVFSAFGCLLATQRVAPSAALTIGIKCNGSTANIIHNHLTDNGIGIELTASPVSISDNTIERAIHGVACQAGSDAQISNNIIKSCGHLVQCIGSAPVVSNNDLSFGCNAVYANTAASPFVINNTIHDIFTVGVECGDSEITIENNRFTKNSVGVRLVDMTGTSIIRNNVFYNHTSGVFDLSDNLNGSITIEANTIDKNSGGAAIFCQRGSSPVIRRNIIMRSPGGITCLLSSFPTIECNDMFNVQSPFGGNCQGLLGVAGNFSLDPQFCGIPDGGNYSLQNDSPCAPGHHPSGYECGGRIGAFDVGCGPVSTKSVTWGAVKSMYREGKP